MCNIFFNIHTFYNCILSIDDIIVEPNKPSKIELVNNGVSRQIEVLLACNESVDYIKENILVRGKAIPIVTYQHTIESKPFPLPILICN